MCYSRGMRSLQNTAHAFAVPDRQQTLPARVFLLLAAAVLLLTGLITRLPAPVSAFSTELAHAYGGTNQDMAYCVIEHSLDNGFVLAGQSSSYSSVSDDFQLVKTTSLGVELWTKTYGGSNSDWAFSVIEHSIDQGLVIAGQTVSQLYMIVKTNSVGTELWTKTYGGSNSDEARSVTEHSIDQGLLLAGSTYSFGAGGQDIMLVKTNSMGVVQWTKTYGGSADDSSMSVIEHSIDQGLVLAGKTTTFGANGDVLLVKTDSMGVEQWTKTYGGSSYEDGKSVIEHSIDNGLLIGG
jgi:hypothetical protein